MAFFVVDAAGESGRTKLDHSVHCLCIPPFAFPEGEQIMHGNTYDHVAVRAHFLAGNRVELTTTDSVCHLTWSLARQAANVC